MSRASVGSSRTTGSVWIWAGITVSASTPQLGPCRPAPALGAEARLGARVVPTARRAEPEAIGGRGVALIDTLATRWGVHAASGTNPDADTSPDASTSGGKTVWFELPAHA